MTRLPETSFKTVEHKLPSTLLNHRVNIVLIGCGGTGSTMAVGLVYLHQALLAFGHPHGLHVTVVDGDRISHANCVRQPFSENEIGLYKAHVLVNRINLFWGLDWRAETRYVDSTWEYRDTPHLLISCVDTRAARKAITRSAAYRDSCYWLDLGNNAESGQFVLGQPDSDRCPEGIRLPTVADLFPEILDPALDARDKLPSCSALEALESQSPFVNQTLAYQALGMLAQFFRRGRLAYHGGFLNLATGRVSALPLDPIQWERLALGDRTRRNKNVAKRFNRRTKQR
jgi:PRTRC genetic system ThiF family protein